MKTETTEWSRAMLLLAALLATSGAHAKAYKCVVAGKTTFQDQPCIEEKVIAPTPAKPQEGGATLGSDAFFNAADKPPYHPATVADLATATPRDFLMRSLKACEDKNEGNFFAQFTYRMREAFSHKPPTQRAQMFELYCQSLTPVSVKDMITNRTFSIMQGGMEAGVHKSSLCWRPKDAPTSLCRDMVDVAIEKGQLKRDEF